MLPSFQRRFAPFIEDGSKTHTIREPRKTPIRVGDRLDLYVDPRQKSMRLLGRYLCSKVQKIEFARSLRVGDVRIFIDGAMLTQDEVERFAWRDGFRRPGRSPVLQLLDFWSEHNRALPWYGDLIHWDPAKPVAKGKT